MFELSVRRATGADLAAIRRIYNEGIEDRIATLDEAPKTEDEIARWFGERDARFQVVVAMRGPEMVGWASLNPYSHRCAYRDVADLSIYVAREARGKGFGFTLLEAIERIAVSEAFHKIVLFALAHNRAGLQLYRKRAFREVGVFREQGRLDGQFVDVVAMEKIVSSSP